MSYTKKVAYNTIAQFIGKAVGIAVALVTTAVLFRYLGVEGVGKYTTAFAFVAFVSVFADFGLGWTMLRELSIAKDQSKVFKNIFAFRFIIALVFHLLAIAAIWFFNYPIDVKLAVGVLSIAWFFQTLNSTAISVFIQNYRLDIAVTTEIIGKLLVLATVYLISRTNLGLPYIMGSYFVGNMVNLGVNLLFARRYVDVGFAYDKVYWKYAIKQAFPIGIVLVFGYVYWKIDSLMLSLMKGMTDVGIYGTPYKLIEVLQTFPALFLGTTFPLVTKYIVNNDERRYSAFQKEFDFLVLAAVPMIAITFVLAAPIISFIAGSRGAEFINASTVTIMGLPMTAVSTLRILILSVGISFISILYNFTIVSLGKQKQMIWPTISLAIFNIGLNLVLIPRISYIGSALATLATEIALSITVYFIVKKNMRLPVRLDGVAKIVASGVVIGIFAQALLLAHVNFLVIAVLSLVVYAGIVLLLKAVSIELVRSMFAKEAK